MSFTYGVIAVASLSASVAATAKAQQAERAPGAAGVPTIQFDASVDFLKLPPDLYFGEVAGVAMDARRHLFVFSRTGSRTTVHGAAASQLFEFGPDGSGVGAGVTGGRGGWGGGGTTSGRRSASGTPRLAASVGR